MLSKSKTVLFYQNSAHKEIFDVGICFSSLDFFASMLIIRARGVKVLKLCREACPVQKACHSKKFTGYCDSKLYMFYVFQGWY